MSSIAQSTQTKSLASIENPGSTISTQEGDASTQSIANQDAAIEAIRKRNDRLREKVNRSMKDFGDQPAPNYQQDGNANKPGK